MDLSIEQYDTYSPLSAAMDGRPEVEQRSMMQSFTKLSDEEKAVLAGTGTAEAIFRMISDGTIPETHGKAVAKMIYLVLTGEIPMPSIASVLQRLDLSEAVAKQIALFIESMVAPALSARAVTSLPSTLSVVPPLTVQRPASMGPNMPPRNIIDLRKPPETP